MEHASPDAEELGRLRWRCRRGMRELDLLLTHYVDAEYATASAAHRRAFRRLLDSQDPLIYAYFLGVQDPPGEDLSTLIKRITAARPNDR